MAVFNGKLRPNISDRHLLRHVEAVVPDSVHCTSYAAVSSAVTTIKNPLVYRRKPPSFWTRQAISVRLYQPFAAMSKGDSENSMKDFSNGDLQISEPPPPVDGEDDGIEIEIEKLSKNRRRIQSKISVQASLQTVWNILTDYERLSDFIPGLAISQLLEKKENFARLFQIGQQDLAFGLKFNAKGVIDCYEKDLESFPHGERRDIEFKMIEGDFRLFKGKWSIEQSTSCLVRQEFLTTLSYVVEVEPKMWLPVQLVEGRLCREIKVNLSCIRQAAVKASSNISCD